MLGVDGGEVARLWRLKQLEYTFRLTVMGQYLDFRQVPSHALVFALASARTAASCSRSSRGMTGSRPSRTPSRSCRRLRISPTNAGHERLRVGPQRRVQGRFRIGHGLQASANRSGRAGARSPAAGAHAQGAPFASEPRTARMRGPLLRSRQMSEHQANVRLRASQEDRRASENA